MKHRILKRINWRHALKLLNPCRHLTRRLRTRIIDLSEEKCKLSNKVREKQATIDGLRRQVRRLERR